MAKGAELEVGGCPPHTIYINLSSAVLANSWGWPQAWHEAFELALYRLCKQVVESVLNGHALNPQANELRGPAGRLRFSVSCLGTRIEINVFSFVGPHDPGPDGGTWQPRPSVDRVLGVYVADRAFSFVAFYGPPRPGELVDIARQLRVSSSLTSLRWIGARGLPQKRLTTVKTTISATARMVAVLPGMHRGRSYSRDLADIGVSNPENEENASKRIKTLSNGKNLSAANLHSAASRLAWSAGAITGDAIFCRHLYALTSKPRIAMLAQAGAGWRGSSWRNGAPRGMKSDLLRFECSNSEPGLSASIPLFAGASSSRSLEFAPSGSAANMRLH